ncbi:MAG: sensor histidine kinase [Flavisolibacter sp.]|jgi:two-component system LytT family sensor kinase
MWAALHLLILYRFGFPLTIALWDSLVSNVLLAFLSIMVTIILQFYIPQKNKYGFILVLCFVLAIIWFFVSRSLLMLILGGAPDYYAFFSESIFIRMAFGFLVIGCMALVSVLWYTIQDQQETDRRKVEAEKLAREAELYKLRQQLQPHFLFNSLNSINALIGTRPQQARTMIQQLSDFLRGTLKKEDDQWISLEEELTHLELYLDIEKLRFGHRLSTEVRNETIGTPFQLPAMLLQPVVENAIKFGLYDTTGDITISIEAKQQDGNLVLEVTNPFDPETASPKKGTGFGLSSVQRRLYLLFARSDLVQTRTQENLFITTIKIPQLHDQGNHNR